MPIFAPFTSFILLLVGLTACAYQPIYSPELSNRVSVGKVAMADAANLPGERRIAQHVHQRLQQTFPKAGNSHVVHVTITESTKDLAVRRDASVERSEVVLSAKINVTLALNQSTQTTLKAAAAYNVEQSPFSTESGKQFARLRAAETLSDSIIRWVGHTLRQP